jgi:membrane-associated HD superfamily phosphohydrolase
MDQINQLRKYKLSTDQNNGIAIFDLVLTFAIAFALDYFFKLHSYFPGKTDQKKLIIYYSLFLPLGILAHKLSGVDSFLTNQLFNKDLNVYKGLAVANVGLVGYALF